MTSLPASPSRPGVNVIGHLSSSAGLGNTTRLFIDLLHRRGHDVAGFDVESYAHHDRPNLPADRVVHDIQQLPFDHNLVIASVDRLPQLWLRHAKSIAEPRFRNACMLFWELPVVPPAWIPALKMFDCVVACSQYVRQTFEAVAPEVPTVYAEHPLAMPSSTLDRAALRRKHGIPQEVTAFCCSFDPRSGFARKNPIAAITAWLRAFPSRTDVCLVVKSNGPPISDDFTVGEILKLVAQDTRIVWIADRLQHDEVMSLFACCDVFVSLHRAEGLGLVPMEAMSMGKLVIATGYSGNMTFMTEQNSLPVPYRLIEPRDDRHFLTRSFAGANAAWGRPRSRSGDALHAACSRGPGSRQAPRRAGRASTSRNGRRRRGEAISSTRMIRLLDASTRVPLRHRIRRQILVPRDLQSRLAAKERRRDRLQAQAAIMNCRRKLR